MATVVDVEKIASSFPNVETSQRRGSQAWEISGKVFAWVRPFSKADVRRYGNNPIPSGDIVAVYVSDLGDKDALLATATKGIFTIEHLNGYPIVLLQLKVIGKRALQEALEDAWLCTAPAPLVNKYLQK